MAGHAGDVQVVLSGLAADDPELRATALGAAARLKILDDRTLIEHLNDPSVVVRRRALELAPRGDRRGSEDGAAPAELTAAIIGLLDEPTAAEAAAFALGELGQADGPVVAGLERQSSDHDDPLCREAAVAALGALGAGRATVLAATDDVATVRRRAVIALANFEGDDVESALRRALDDRDWQVRQAAEDLLDPAP